MHLGSAVVVAVAAAMAGGGERGGRSPLGRKKGCFPIYNINNRKSTDSQKVHRPELVYPSLDFS